VLIANIKVFVFMDSLCHELQRQLSGRSELSVKIL
jgi:hypothetical protein